ncbi:cytokine receptor common subunit beta [Halichoeres trimaculatus]|uniref:cytokine receptor common subunit beta n=1 Tax=Halichoeres trimaculatus TaxID=147232 RepID=UPI003D9E4486
MLPLLWAVLSSALPAWALTSGPNSCDVQESSSLRNESSLLKSLHCHNDYESYVCCRWRGHGLTDVQLWFKTENKNELCEPYEAAGHGVGEHTTVHCRYKTQAFSIGIEHTVFFLHKKTHYSSVPHQPLDLSQHLRARTPVNLSTHDVEDGGRGISWSSPYSSSSLNKHMNYQLGYRAKTQDNWTTLSVTNTSVRLQKHLLIPGLQYEARVRARTNVAQWSDWSPVVTWMTQDDAGHSPSMHCVLEGESEVMCSWELSKDTAHFISYQLACRHNLTAPSEECCRNCTVTRDPSGTVLKYSCLLTVTDPEHLLLELVPTRNAKTFKACEHIQPKPPQQVKVREKGRSWRVDWTDPSTATKVGLNYEACYYRTEEQECSIFVRVDAMSLTILDSSLVPSQCYRVKVRSLVDPGPDSTYGGIPSKWSDPVEWTSHEATWSPDTLIYCSIAGFVALVFLAFYFMSPAFKRKLILWVDSIPSPGKSKVLSEVKTATTQTLMQNENTSFCKVQHSESLSTCSSDAPLWLTKDAEGKFLEEDEGCWTNDHLPVPAEVKGSDKSSMSFSGPYIFCEPLGPNKNPEDVKHEERGVKETPECDPVSLPVGGFTLWGEDYVRLPGRVASAQDLVSHSEADKNTTLQVSAEQNQQGSGRLAGQDYTDVKATDSSLQTPSYTSVTLTSWPQEGAIQASGYCHLPTAHVSAVK